MTGKGVSRVLFKIAIGSLVVLVAALTITNAWDTRVESGDGLLTLAAVTSFITFVVSTIGAALTGYFGWRKDRREQREHEFKMAELQAQKSGSPPAG